MCGRFTLSSSGDVLVDAFDLQEPLDLSPRYNIAPSQPILTVTTDEQGRRHTASMRWGLIPSWAKDASIGNRLINARSETAAAKPAFRSAFRQRRCLVPADGFYEWQATPGSKRKQPFHFRRADAAPFAIAALWERWREPDGDTLHSCTLLTTAANALVAPVHPRMPVILPPQAYGPWLAAATDAASLQALLHPFDAAAMTGYPVSSAVNRPANDDVQNIQALTDLLSGHTDDPMTHRHD